MCTYIKLSKVNAQQGNGESEEPVERKCVDVGTWKIYEPSIHDTSYFLNKFFKEFMIKYVISINVYWLNMVQSLFENLFKA